jgi:hypothetical protein
VVAGSSPVDHPKENPAQAGFSLSTGEGGRLGFYRTFYQDGDGGHGDSAHRSTTPRLTAPCPKRLPDTR